MGKEKGTGELKMKPRRKAEKKKGERNEKSSQ